MLRAWSVPRWPLRPGLARQGPCVQFPVAVCLVVAALLTCIPGTTAAQEGRVSGTVVDSRTQQPLAGVQVAVPERQTGALTDVRGRFRLDGLTGESVTLQVVMLGYRTVTQVARVGDQAVQILMTEVALDLDGIVVTGTAGGTRSRAIGNAVGRVGVEDIVQRAPIQNVQGLLSGRVAGVVVLPSSGMVGTGGVTRIRGVSSLSLSNEPLIYIDGVRVNNDPAGGPNIRQGRQVNRLNDINPNDIESIEVIKGPAAATLYGTEASNGVIQIITKKGAQGTPTLDLTLRQGATWLASPESRIEPVFGRDASGQVTSLNLLEQERLAGNPIFTTGHLQGYDAGVRGGTENVRYYVSSDYENNTGIVPYNWQKRFSARSNLQVTPSERFDGSLSMGWTSGKTRFAQAASGWGIWDQLVWGTPNTRDERNRGFLRATPEAAGEIESYTNIGRFIGSVTLNFRPWEWFSHRLVVGTDVTSENNSILFRRHPDGTAYFFGALSLGDKTVEENRAIYNTIDYGTTVNLTPMEGLGSATSFGVQYYTKRFESSQSIGRQFPAPSVTTVGGAAQTFGSEDLVENKTLGMYIQQQFSISDRIFLTAAVRADDNSAFGENFSIVTYPKFSGTWVISEESFWNVAVVDELKLRGAWGRAGQQPDVFAAVRLYSPATGRGDGSVLTPQSLGNPDLEPEKGEELELGFDAGLFGDRLSLAFTYYSQKTRDAILQRTISPSVGFPGSQFVNLGEIHNQGTETTAVFQALQGESTALELGVNYSTNKSKVADLGGLAAISFGIQEHREGYPIGSFFQRRVISAEVDAAGRATNILCDGGPESGGQGVPCAGAPTVFWGVPNPTWEGSGFATLTIFRDLRLYALVEFRGGHMIESGDIRASHSTFRNSRAINEGTDPILLAYDQTGITNPLGFFDAGFAKLREVSATYSLPTGLASRFGASRASITVAGRNLATLWTAQEEIFGHRIPDPEIRTPSSNLSGYVQTVIPPLSTLITTVRISF
jgi:TonB-dependent SusC/RagA subfamily outer membrane receptor